MPGFELFGDLERASVNEVLDTGVLMRYGFDGMRKDRWMALELEQKLAPRMQTQYAHLTSSGTSALTVALACMGIGAGDEVIMPTLQGKIISQIYYVIMYGNIAQCSW